ncbi:MAG: hypothetical protein PHU64_05585 [Candidatus Omnitrophica bacterium]|nr:hypothetical protein [Candidatus Omnitrophota bacterium]MDD5429701.1 hypothetical protein [Candidatus Omnitrophota bacterium]
MKRKSIRLSILLLLLFFLDIIRPLGYSLHVEFACLGLMFIALNEKLWFTLTIGFVLGYLKDSFLPTGGCFYCLELPFLAAISCGLRSYFFLTGKKAYLFLAKSIVVTFFLTAHIIYNSLVVGFTEFSMCFSFFIQSFFCYFMMEALLDKPGFFKSSVYT